MTDTSNADVAKEMPRELDNTDPLIPLVLISEV